MKNALGNALLVAGSVLVFLVIAEIALRFLPVTDIVLTRPVAADAEPFDVSAAAHAAHRFSRRFDFRNARTRKTNNLGFFSDFDFARGAEVDVAIGDSFVEALQVDFDAAFHQLLARGRTRPVYAIGVSGAPLSQYEAYLAQACADFRIGKAVFTINSSDFDQSLFPHRSADGFFHYHSDGGETVLKPTPFEVTPLRALANGSSLVRYVYFNLGGARVLRRLFRPTRRLGTDADEEARRIAAGKRAIDLFLGRIGGFCLQRQDMLFAVDADRGAIYGEPPYRYFLETRAYFIARARAAGFTVLDLQPVFAADYAAHGRRFEYPYDRHWNARGHAVVAAALGRALGTK